MNKIIEITEEVQVGEVILEKGDRVEVITESALGNLADTALNSLSKLYGALDKAGHAKTSAVLKVRNSLEKLVSDIG